MLQGNISALRIIFLENKFHRLSSMTLVLYNHERIYFKLYVIWIEKGPCKLHCYFHLLSIVLCNVAFLYVANIQFRIC
jgi:hypothetical protein